MQSSWTTSLMASRWPRGSEDALAFYSVAQHAVAVANTIEKMGRADLAVAALHHDSHEAYACDIPRPLKQLLEPRYGQITDRLDQAIAEALKLPRLTTKDREFVKAADDAVFCVEAEVLLRDAPLPNLDRDALSSARWASAPDKPRTPREARARFIETHRRLVRGPKRRRRHPRVPARSARSGGTSRAHATPSRSRWCPCPRSSWSSYATDPSHQRLGSRRGTSSPPPDRRARPS